jgi:hypothetical protein
VDDRALGRRRSCWLDVEVGRFLAIAGEVPAIRLGRGLR